MTGSNEPVLWDADGKPLSREGGLLAPAALSVAQIIQNTGRVYSYRWDEAMRDAPQNALAMRRNPFYLALLQERCAPTENLDWRVKVQNEDDPVQKLDGDIMQRAWDELPDKPNLLRWLANHGCWCGRAASQGTWERTPSGLWNWIDHEPVHGDSIQYQWDKTPVVLVSHQAAQRVRRDDPAAVIWGGDRGAFGLRLYKPEYRRRFVIHTHAKEAADYYEGEMSGGVHGVGLRSWAYWADYIRSDALAAMTGFAANVGLMDILVFNFLSGDAAAEARAKENARKISDKIAFICPRETMVGVAAIEQYPMNSAGVDSLKNLIREVYDVQIERLFVGQSMSAGGGGSGGLEGDGRADFARDTKFQLVKSDARKIAETLTRDWLIPCLEYNRPGSTTQMRLEPVLDDEEADKADRKAQNVVVCVSNGIEIEEDEAREALGFRKPRDGKKTLGKKEEMAAPPGMPGQPPGKDVAARPPGQKPPVPKAGADLVTDFLSRLDSLRNDLTVYRAAQPPWPGAIFDEQAHRWKNPDGSDGPTQASGRAATPGPDAGKLDDEVKGWAARIKEYGPKAVAAAQAVGRKAWELSVRVSWFVAEHDLVEQILDTPRDYSKIINAKGTGDFLSTHLGVGGNTAAVIASHLLSYGFAKLKQAMAARGKAGTTTSQADAFPLTYADEFEGKADKAELLTEVIRDLLAAAGVPSDNLPDAEDVRAWLAGDPAATYGAEHAPVGGVSVGGKQYVGGQFIPGDVVARATPEERKAIRGDGGKPDPKGRRGGRAATPSQKSDPKKVAGNRTKAGQKIPQKKSIKGVGGVVDIARSRRIKAAHKREKELADAIGGFNLLDSEPADVAYMPEVDAGGRRTGKGISYTSALFRQQLSRRAKMVERMKDESVPQADRDAIQKLLEQDQPLVFFEVKTLLKSKRDEVRINPAALKAKEAWSEKYHALFHVVIVDDRKGKKHSGHRVHVQPQDQTVGKVHKLAGSTKLPTMGDVLKHAGL